MLSLPRVQQMPYMWEGSCTQTPALPVISRFFTFHEQEPNSDNRRHNYLICHLIQVEGQKKSLDEIKASLKQLVHVPSNFNGLGTQIQLFGAALTIFFGEDSVCTSNLNQLLTMIVRNKKTRSDCVGQFFCRQIPFCN
jgi:hypothetical protein